MKERKTIATKNLPTRIPLLSFVVIYLLLDKFNAPGYVYGIVGTLAVIILIALIYGMCTEQEVDIFKEDDKRSER